MTWGGVDLTATGGGYYRVRVAGIEVSRHTAEREAAERAVELKRANPAAEVTYDHSAYVVRVDLPERRTGGERRQRDDLMQGHGRRVGQTRRPTVRFPPDPPVIAMYITTPPPVAFEETDTYQFEAQVTSEERVRQNDEWVTVPVNLTGKTLVWASSTPATATINSSTGLLTAVAAGTTNVTVSCEGATSAPVSVTVESSAPVVDSVDVTPATFTVFEGATSQLSAVAKDASGNVIPGLTATWGSSNESVATVNSSGLVTGVAAGSATITATISTVGGTSAATVSVVPEAGTLVTFANPKLEYMLGPLLAPGDGLIDGTSATLATHPWPWHDKIWAERGQDHIDSHLSYWPQTLPGTVAITNNSNTVTGTSTNFLTSIEPDWPIEPLTTLYGNVNYWGEIMIRDAGSVWRGPFYAASVESDTSFTLTANWTFGDVTGVNISTSNPTRLSGQKQADLLSDRKYYDPAYCMQKLAYASGDAGVLAGARKMADAWASAPQINWGYAVNTAIAGRSLSPNGLIVRAIELDDAAETHALWDWLIKWLNSKWNTWIGSRFTQNTLHYGLRDGSYVQMVCTHLARCLPDTYTTNTGATATDGAAKRAQYRQQARDGAIQYFIRLQGTAPDASETPPGLWRWDDSDVNPKGRSWNITFQNGIVGDALIWTHRMLEDTSWGTAQDLTDIEDSIVALCEAMYESGNGVTSWTAPMFRQGLVTDKAPNKWRAPYYYYYGGNANDTTLYMPDNLAIDGAIGGDDFNKMAESRQRSGMNATPFGFAYHVTGDAKFLQYGDDVFSATFGRGKYRSGGSLVIGDKQGVGADDYGSLFWDVAKSFNQCYRNSAHYLAWRNIAPRGA